MGARSSGAPESAAHSGRWRSLTATPKATPEWTFACLAGSAWFTPEARTSRAPPQAVRRSRRRSGRPRACSRPAASPGARRATNTSWPPGTCRRATRSAHPSRPARQRPQRQRDALARRQKPSPRLHPLRRRRPCRTAFSATSCSRARSPSAGASKRVAERRPGSGAKRLRHVSAPLARPDVGEPRVAEHRDLLSTHSEIHPTSDNGSRVPTPTVPGSTLGRAGTRKKNQRADEDVRARTDAEGPDSGKTTAARARRSSRCAASGRKDECLARPEVAHGEAVDRLREAWLRRKARTHTQLSDARKLDRPAARTCPN